MCGYAGKRIQAEGTVGAQTLGQDGVWYIFKESRKGQCDWSRTRKRFKWEMRLELSQRPAQGGP